MWGFFCGLALFADLIYAKAEEIWERTNRMKEVKPEV